jgi:putative flippase GtrA
MTERKLPEASLWRMSPAVKIVSAAQPGPDPLVQDAGIQVPQALAVTQPLKPVDAEMLARSNHSDPGTTHDTGSSHPATNAVAPIPASPQQTTWLGEFAREHGGKLALFSVIGATVFAFGLALQAMLVREAGIGPVAAYAIQTIISIEVAYVLNRYLTWRDRDVRFWAACARFTVQRVMITIPSLVVYAELIRLHLGYLWANAVTTTAFTVINYSVGHLWSFAPDADADSTSPWSAGRAHQTAHKDK